MAWASGRGPRPHELQGQQEASHQERRKDAELDSERRSTQRSEHMSLSHDLLLFMLCMIRLHVK